MKLSILALLFLSISTLGNERTSETLDARKGLYRLLAAEMLDKGAYHFRTSMEFFEQNELLKDTDLSKVRDTKATLAFGYALTPYLLLSAEGGFNIASRTPKTAAGATSAGSDAINLTRGALAATGYFDMSPWFRWNPHRLVAGFSLWIDFSRITRFIDSPNIIPTAMFTADFTDNATAPFRIHLNAGFRPANGKRFYDDATIPKDYDRFVTDTINSWAWTTGLGLEFPLTYVNPSAELHMVKTANTGFGETPKWVTVGLKGKPFPTKNIELFGGADIGISSFKATPTGIKPDAPVVPLWNAFIGFAVSQFGLREGETTVSEAAYNKLKSTLNDQDVVLQGLKRDLEYNVIQGRVVDATTKQPLVGVSFTFPENPDLKGFRSDSEGRFVHYYKNLTGSRLVVAMEGYDASSKFLSLKPGERVTVDIELKKANPNNNLADFVANITNEAGLGLVANVRLTNTQTGQAVIGTTDSSGQISFKVMEGSYRLDIVAANMRPLNEMVVFEKGKTVLRSYMLTVTAPSPTTSPATSATPR
jgi:hypothetical protein